MVAQLLTRLHRAVDRTLHPTRLERARQLVEGCAEVREILVLCHGNICRSPFAAARLARRLASYGVRVTTAGFLGQGRPSPRDALAAAAEFGVDLREHRSRLVVPSLLSRADLMIVMDEDQHATLRFDFGIPASRILLLGDLDPGTIPERGITDPWDRPLDEFRAVYARIDRCVGALVALLIRAGAVSRRTSPAQR
jgi:protein-tyrosine phosphatase